MTEVTCYKKKKKERKLPAEICQTPGRLAEIKTQTVNRLCFFIRTRRQKKLYDVALMSLR